MGSIVELFPKTPEPSKAERLVQYALRILDTHQQLTPYYLEDQLLINGWVPLGFFPINEQIFLRRHAAKNQDQNYFTEFRDEKSFHNNGRDGYVVYGRAANFAPPFEHAVHLFYKEMTWTR